MLLSSGSLGRKIAGLVLPINLGFYPQTLKLIPQNDMFESLEI